MTDFTLEPARDEDIDAIIHLQHAAFEPDARLLRTHELEPFLQTREDVAAEAARGVLLKCTTPDGQIVGTIRGIEENGICEILKLAVHPQFQNRGIARALMLKLESLFPHCRRFELYTRDGSGAACHLYLSLGYTITGRAQRGAVPMVFMAKANPACSDDA